MEKEKKGAKQDLSEILQFVAPGTPLREGIENVLRAKTGGLIVVGFNDKVKEVVDGGFHINSAFSPAHLYELAKMDGAIILSDSGQKILYANTQLMPEATIPSSETGMRHRTAERVAKQTGCLIIAISERRNVITLYQENMKYILKDIGFILTKANQAIQTLEKYKLILDNAISTLSALEFEELVTFGDVISVMHRYEMVLRIKNEINMYIKELGTEGHLIRLQVSELITDMEQEAALFVKDYVKEKIKDPFVLLKQLQDMSSFELLDDSILLKLLGYSATTNMEEYVFPRGYRLLHKIPRLPMPIVENVVEAFGHLKLIIEADVKELDEVEGIGAVRAQKIKKGLKRLQEKHYIDRQL
ncbi:DNA integrity scanning protein DisA [Bacillus glycinifermentans]|uniref:DNA integrity scanning protein DisA n=1 Tax=Bacillus glycinifermentans TaxID=1664069 RepID=A0A0J6EJK4_9BACI|nr:MULTISPECIES: DNA integrity scanning diadenylate cyclase DisA [Bacillus]ATH94021.1 DNA integrity scanning protein DisA [Bacillus glycinifermentans]KKB75700.1 DNA integrity scanning protein DisA [Bacillus sp. TH008]KMM60656.1 DNA integrity scanning protein DisA [Bacillus glycinifermentans]KRT92748.1 DNA integrity scanning protein DisA [Bacillus glycinifermentans]MBU8787923.1 DNA integrity scanning diadenylate cyclase DisA [Bacillus glycinifermentans]